MTTLGFFSLGIPEVILILVVILVIFGPGKLPQIGKSFGQALGNFKKSAKEDYSEDVKDTKKIEDSDS